MAGLENVCAWSTWWRSQSRPWCVNPHQHARTHPGVTRASLLEQDRMLAGSSPQARD
jgi:hypothetical protein